MTLLNAQAFVVISSEMATNELAAATTGGDPRLAAALSGPVLHPRTSYSKDRRIVLCHATEKSRFTLTCATDNALESSCPHSYKVAHTTDFGQVAFTIEARPAVRSNSPNTWSITPRRRLPLKSSAAVLSGQWIAW